MIRRLAGVAVAGVAVALMGFGSVASAGTNLCVATNGEVRAQKGTASCSADEGAGNVAIAHGDKSTATVLSGVRNRATASGDSSTAATYDGDGNTAIATGDSSIALAGGGDGNTAIATGDHSIALAGEGDGNTATAITDGCTADATGSGQTDTC